MHGAAYLFIFASFAVSQGTENLNAVSWMQTAAEYQAIARQTYGAGQVALERALAQPQWTAALEQIPDITGDFQKLPPAVILDLDETVLDNSPFQARNVVNKQAFSDSLWQSWVREKKAGLVPGAREFLAFAHARGVVPFYITNRQCEPENAGDPTVAIVRLHLLPFASNRLLCRTDSGDKSARRRHVARTHRVLLMFGDDLNDFVTLPLEVGPRADFVAAQSSYWGERWFMLPNPAYGSWERSVGDKQKALRQ